MPKKRTSIYLFSYFLLYSLQVFASDVDLKKSGSLEAVGTFIQANPDKVTISDEETQAKSEKQAKELPKVLPKYFLFLDFQSKPLPDLKDSLSAKPKIMAEWLIKEDLIEAYDKRFEEYQEYILTHSEALSDKEKEQIEALFESINAELNTVESVTPIKNHDEKLLGLDTPSSSSHKPPSMKQVGEIPGKDVEDGSSNIRIADSSKKGVLRKPSFGGKKGPGEEEKTSSLNLVNGVCQDKASKKMVNINLEILEKNVENLERALLDESNTVEERIQIYCTLHKYYELTDNSTRLIEFLYLNMPADDIKCP